MVYIFLICKFYHIYVYSVLFLYPCMHAYHYFRLLLSMVIQLIYYFKNILLMSRRQFMGYSHEASRALILHRDKHYSLNSPNDLTVRPPPAKLTFPKPVPDALQELFCVLRMLMLSKHFSCIFSLHSYLFFLQNSKG